MNEALFRLRGTLFAAGLGLACSQAGAQSITITNHSFETPTLADNANTVSGAGTGVFNGWNYAVTSGASFEDFGIENPRSVAYTGATGTGTPSGADGINVAFLNQNNSGLTASIFQDVGLLQANTQYTLTVAVGQRLDRVNGSVQLGLLNGASGATNIWSTGTLLGSTTAVSSVAGSFQDFTVTFTTGSSVSNQLYVGALYTADGTIQASLDNFRLDAVSAIPEPSTYAIIIGAAALGLVALRRRVRA